MAKGIETGDENGQLVPEDDYEYEKRLADEERRKREETEEQQRQREEEAIRRARDAEKARERRIAQERLELIKMKQGIADEEETIKEEHEVYEELHGLKKLENIWYHDKMWIIIGTFVLMVVGFITYDTVTKVNPDLELLLICDNQLQQNQSCELLARRIEKYTPDLNDDGKIKVTVISCAVNPDKYDQFYTINSQKFYANLQQGRIIMVITDSALDPDLNELFTTELPQKIEGNRYIDEQGLHLDFGFLAEELNCAAMPNDVYIRMRNPIKTLSDSQKKMQSNYDTALEIMTAMANDLQAQADESSDKGLPTPEEIQKMLEQQAQELEMQAMS